MFEDVEQFNDRLDKIEENAVIEVFNSLNRDFRAIEKYIDKNYLRLRNNRDLLPDEKTNSLYSGISNSMGNRDRSGVLRGYLDRVRNESANFNQKSNPTIPDNLNNPVDFWAIDSNNRINDWSSKFLEDIRERLRFSYRTGASKSLALSSVRERFGQLLSQAERVINTGTTGVTSSVSERFARANNKEFVILKTTQDDRVCPYCAAREGNVYRVGEITLPLHPSCRCQLIPVTRNQLKNSKLRNQLQDFKKEALKELKAAGGKPNYGVAPFEKKNGLRTPPKSV